MPLAVAAIFDRIGGTQDREFLARVSYMEVPPPPPAISRHCDRSVCTRSLPVLRCRVPRTAAADGPCLQGLSRACEQQREASLYPPLLQPDYSRIVLGTCEWTVRFTGGCGAVAAADVQRGGKRPFGTGKQAARRQRVPRRRRIRRRCALRAGVGGGGGTSNLRACVRSRSVDIESQLVSEHQCECTREEERKTISPLRGEQKPVVSSCLEKFVR